MKSQLQAQLLFQLQARLLQHSRRQQTEQGFTLIELLVVIVIIGLLSAIALPSFLSQAARARESEAKSYISAINRAQQTYRMEEGEFTNNFERLALGLSIETQESDTTATTENYTYLLAADSEGSQGTVTATPDDATAVRAYAGGVFMLTSGQTTTVTCEANETGATTVTAPEAPTGEDTVATCPENFTALGQGDPDDEEPAAGS